MLTVVCVVSCLLTCSNMSTGRRCETAIDPDLKLGYYKRGEEMFNDLIRRSVDENLNLQTTSKTYRSAPSINLKPSNNLLLYASISVTSLLKVCY